MPGHTHMPNIYANMIARPVEPQTTLHYNILSWNVRGMAMGAKRRKILGYLRRHNIHIAFLQETHMTQEGLEGIRKSWPGQIQGTSFSAFSRGVLIWIAREVPFVIS